MAKRVCWKRGSAMSRDYMINWIGCCNMQLNAETWAWRRANMSKSSLPTVERQSDMWSFIIGFSEIGNEEGIGQAHISRLVWQPIVHCWHQLARSVPQRLFCLERKGDRSGNSAGHMGPGTVGTLRFVMVGRSASEQKRIRRNSLPVAPE